MTTFTRKRLPFARRPAIGTALVTGLLFVLVAGAALAAPQPGTGIGLPIDASAEGHRIDWLIGVVNAMTAVLFLDCPAPGDPVGGASEFIEPAVFLKWCASTGVPGAGRVLAGCKGTGLQRPILVWER